MKKSITLITMLLLLAVSFVSCGSKDEPEVKVPFKVVSTNPAYGATSVPQNTVVKIVFSKKIAFNAKYFIEFSEGYPMSVSYDNDKTVSITFTGSGLPKKADVWIAIDGLKSADGEALIFDKPTGPGQSEFYLNFKVVN